MRRRWLITLIIFPLLLAGVAWMVYRQHTVPLSQCSEVYRQYRDFPGIRAAFIKDKQINDTLFLDMTLLQAKDSLSFVALLKQWNKSDEYIEDLMSCNGKETIRFVRRMCKGHPELPRDKDDANNEVIATFPILKSVAIFHTQTPEQIKTVKYANYAEEVNI